MIGEGETARGKLSDLEYAKEFDDIKVSADPKTVCLSLLFLFWRTHAPAGNTVFHAL